MELYHSGKLPLGKSSQLAGLCKTDFIKLLSERDYSLFNWEEEEIKSELEMVDKLSRRWKMRAIIAWLKCK
jgi:predicted HTH domain antitoxin